MTTPNVEFIREVVSAIEANPERFNMKQFAKKTDCGTVHCVAGWAATLKLGPPTVTITSSRCDDDATLLWWGHGLDVDPTYVAATAMGLNDDDAEDLFYDFSINTVDDLKSRLTTLTGVTFP